MEPAAFFFFWGGGWGGEGSFRLFLSSLLPTLCLFPVFVFCFCFLWVVVVVFFWSPRVLINIHSKLYFFLFLCCCWYVVCVCVCFFWGERRGGARFKTNLLTTLFGTDSFFLSFFLSFFPLNKFFPTTFGQPPTEIECENKQDMENKGLNQCWR